jgi:hypothetical protein
LVIYGESCAALEKASDADLLREMVGYVAQWPMETHQGSLAVACHMVVFLVMTQKWPCGRAMRDHWRNG